MEHQKPHALVREMRYSPTVTESRIVILQKIKMSAAIKPENKTQKSHFWVFIQKNYMQNLETFVSWCP